MAGTFWKQFAGLATRSKFRILRATSNVYSNIAVRIFIAFFFATYLIHFIVDMLATLFRALNSDAPSIHASVAHELSELFYETTGHYLEAGIGGVVTIMFFILLVSFFLTRLILEPLREASDKQRLFAANASHELRTPLSVLKTLAEVARMRSGKLTEKEVDTFAKGINEEVDRMSRIIEFFVRFSALEDGEQKFQMAPVRLSRLAESVIHNVAHVAKEHGVHLAIDGEMQGVVRGNFTALEELLANLVKNAIAFSPRGETVHIRSSVSDTSIRLHIVDHGQGISEEDLPHIFEPFYQSRSKQHGSGNGLGLTLVKQIAKLHRAKIEVKSVIGTGSTFVVKFQL